MQFVKILSYVVLVKAAYAPSFSNNLHPPLNAGTLTSQLVKRKTTDGSIGTSDARAVQSQISKGARRKTITSGFTGNSESPSTSSSATSAPKLVKRRCGPHRPLERLPSIFMGLRPIAENVSATSQSDAPGTAIDANLNTTDGTVDLDTTPKHYYIGDHDSDGTVHNKDNQSKNTNDTTTALGKDLEKDELFESDFLPEADLFISPDESQMPCKLLASFYIYYETLESFLAPHETLESFLAPRETLESFVTPYQALENFLALHTSY